MSYSAIAAMYGTGKPAVGIAIRRAGGEPRSDASGYMPHELRPEHYHAPAARRLRSLARREKGETVLPVEETGLDNWLAMMRRYNQVVDYHPDYGPNEASPTYGGWHYVNRPADRPTGMTAYDPA
jgi:hypothetical protein